MKPFQLIQLSFTEYLRGSGSKDTAEAQKSRRQEIYRDLVYKNINHCIADVFPITKNFFTESEWEILIREFIRVHRLQTPYFLEICQEFLVYFMHTRKLLQTDPPFALELAHFEWIQLAVDIADTNIPECLHNSAPSGNSLWKASPLVVGLTYFYPVHLIDEYYLPKGPGVQPTYLLVYRNKNDDLNVLETDNLSLRIIQLLQAHENINRTQIYQFLTVELGDHKSDIILTRIWPILCLFAEKEIILYD